MGLLRRCLVAAPCLCMSTNLKLVLGGAVGLALIVALAFSLASESPTDHGVQSAPVSVSGSPLPVLRSDAAEDVAVGSDAPVVSGVDFDGNEVVVGGASQKVQLLFFAAHWCPHCQAELPRIVDYLAANGEPDGVETTVVLTSTHPARVNFPPSDWLAREGWSGRVLLDSEESDAAAAFGLSAFPFFVMVDTDGKVLGRLSGEVDPQILYSIAAEAASQSGS